MSKLLRVDPATETGSPIYYGYAPKGTAETAAKWNIERIVIDGAVRKYEYPYGLTEYEIQNSGTTSYFLTNVIWDERTGYTYR